MNRVTRYHPLLVILHWLLALLLSGALGIGFFLLRTMPNADPHKIAVLQVHMMGGMFIGALMLLRLVVRLFTKKPALPAIGQGQVDRQAWFHYGFYVLVIALVASGFTTGWLANLPAIVFAHSGEALPADFSAFPTFLLHATLALLLTVFIVIHIGGAFYHHYVGKRRLMGRVGFGERFAKAQVQ